MYISLTCTGWRYMHFGTRRAGWPRTLLAGSPNFWLFSTPPTQRGNSSITLPTFCWSSRREARTSPGACLTLLCQSASLRSVSKHIAKKTNIIIIVRVQCMFIGKWVVCNKLGNRWEKKKVVGHFQIHTCMCMEYRVMTRFVHHDVFDLYVSSNNEFITETYIVFLPDLHRTTLA